VREVALPRGGLRSDAFRLDGSIPELDALLLQSHIVDVAQPDRRAADEATAFALHRLNHEPHDPPLEEQVVIEEQRVSALRMVE
jgi:hypothetical protein